MSDSPGASKSEYNRDQLTSVLSIAEVLSNLSKEEVESLRAKIQPYLAFRRVIAEYFDTFFRPSCQTLCFDTSTSACCGFESIITFFADHVINLAASSEERIDTLISVLKRPNKTQRCVFLGASGCVWMVPPVSCAMFLCSQVKDRVFDAHPNARNIWSDLQLGEKQFTWPDKPVLFDELEDFFMKRGSESPHLYFHRSPGLLRLKSEAGMVKSDGARPMTKLK